MDLILARGRIWTGNASQPQVEAVAIRDGKIVQAGASDEIFRLRTSRTEVIELHGRCAVPGFNDAHVHFTTAGFSLASVRVRECRNERELRDAIGSFALSRPAGEWILHGEWDPERWPSKQLPNARLIDEVTEHNPVFVRRIDAHTALANSLAMRLAGINKNTPDPTGGAIERYTDGSPTGIFKDAAQQLIERVIPDPTLPDLLCAVEAAQRHAATYGITSVHDMGVVGGSGAKHAAILRAYNTLQRSGRLNVRVSFHRPLMTWPALAGAGITAGFGNANVRIGALKGFADGSLGSRSALFAHAYTDAPDTAGMYSEDMANPTAMYTALQQADEAGLQVAIHAIGDRANSEVLDLFERLIAENGYRDRRLRIEHAQHLLPADFKRFSSNGVIASIQPYHAIDDGCWLEERIGRRRAERSYAFRSLLNAGAILALGSDWPVEPINPVEILSAAVTRKTLDGKHDNGWIPTEKIALEPALRAYTWGSAYASFEEQLKGTIEPGKLADIVVLSDDIFSIPPTEIHAVRVDATIFDGKVLYQRDM